MMNKIFCQDCGRQICHDIFDQEIQAPYPVKHLINNRFVCSDCGIDYDDNGLLPGEHGYQYDEKKISAKI